MAWLAAEYRAGRVNGDTHLSWRLRFLSIDGQAHIRCSTAGSTAGREDCALYLTAWQNWRAENGVGFAYFPTPPGPDEMVATNDGDRGSPRRELGDGWWWVE